MADDTPPVLPATPWYQSPVQRAAVFATISSMVALGIQLFGVEVDAQLVNVKIGIVAQLSNLGFGLWAIVKRQTSAIQPLTITKAGAVTKNIINPPAGAP